MSQNQFSPFHLINFLTAMKSFVPPHNEDARGMSSRAGRAEVAEGLGQGQRGTQAQIASFAFARTQDRAQEGTEAAGARAGAAGGREATTSTMTMRMKQYQAREEAKKEPVGWLAAAAYPEGGKQGAARTHLPCHEPLTVSWRRCRCSFLTLRLVASHLKLC